MHYTDPKPLTKAELVYDDFYTYSNFSAVIRFMGDQMILIPELKDEDGNPYGGKKLVQYLFKEYFKHEITVEQAHDFMPYFILEMFSKMPEIDPGDEKTREERVAETTTRIKELCASEDFKNDIEQMFELYSSIKPFLHKELDKLHDLHPETRNNAVQYDDLKALVFSYMDLSDDELEPLFEKCRTQAIKEEYKGGTISYHKYFEYIYAAVKAARQAVLKEVNQDKRKKERTQRSKQQTFTQIQENGFEKLGKLKSSIIPSSSIFGLINWTLKAGKSGLGELPERITQQAKGKKEVTFTRNGQFREITQTTKKAQDTVIIEVDALLESRQNSPARKIFLYVLSQILQQALSNNDVIRDGVFIKYQDMVDKGMYSDRTAAKRGLERAFDILSSIKVKGYIMHGKKKLEQVKASVLFYDLEHKKNGAAIIRINDTINWEYIIQQYAMLPDAYYELPPNAADLYYLIFNQARINIKKLIENDGKINISYKTIQNHLGLPTADTATNPTTQIKKPISNAIGDILDSTQDALYIEEITPADYTNINEYLERGYITAKINDDYLKEYAKKVKEWDKAKLEAKKRNQKNADIARQKAIQKQIEQENKNS